MSSSFVTQCPHCRTSFRVSSAQLGAANGAVRCGACLHVFNAAEHLLGGQPPAPIQSPPPAAQITPVAPPPAAPRPEPTKAAGETDETLWIHDDLDLDSLDLDEELAKLERQEMQFSQAFLALEKAPKPAESFLAAEEKSRDPHDERWAEALLRDDPPAAKPSTLSTADAAPAASTARPPQAEETPSAELDQQPPPNPAIAAERIEPAWSDTPLEQEAEEDLAPPSRAATDHRNPLSRERNEPSFQDDGLFHLADEPLQLDWQKPQAAWGRRLLWTLLNLIALAILAGQYVAYHFDELARQDQYRPWFEQFCPTLGCTLPSKVDIAQIKSSNLMVRAHPEFTGALIVDAILYNRAIFSQPFPLLEMRFADINGQLLASRRFKPAEYLAGELAGQTEMPPQTPIRISLEILDPGLNAVNYSLSFHSPE